MLLGTAAMGLANSATHRHDQEPPFHLWALCYPLLLSHPSLGWLPSRVLRWWPHSLASQSHVRGKRGSPEHHFYWKQENLSQKLSRGIPLTSNCQKRVTCLCANQPLAPGMGHSNWYSPAGGGPRKEGEGGGQSRTGGLRGAKAQGGVCNNPRLERRQHNYSKKLFSHPVTWGQYQYFSDGGIKARPVTAACLRNTSAGLVRYNSAVTKGRASSLKPPTAHVLPIKACMPCFTCTWTCSMNYLSTMSFQKGFEADNLQI